MNDEPTTSGVVVVDLDGVIWVGDEPVASAAGAVDALRRHGADVLFLTNNSSQTVAEFVAKLERSGVSATDDDVLTSALATAELLAGDLEAGSRVLACAGPGVREALDERGFVVVDQPPCAAVVVGWHRGFDFDEMASAAAAVRGGARFVATNLDPTYPAPGGLLPGNGALVASVVTASAREPEVAGKPEQPTVEMVRARADGRPGLVVGDRPSTDGALASALGWPFALVHSAVTATDGERGPEPLLEGDELATFVEGIVEHLGERA